MVHFLNHTFWNRHLKLVAKVGNKRIFNYFGRLFNYAKIFYTVMIPNAFIFSFMATVLIMNVGYTQNALIIGHRGSSYVMPENTVISAKKGWEEGADAVEIDVYPTADGKIVVLHDKSTKRTTGKDYIVTETNSEKLKSLDAGKWKGSEFEGELLPFLPDVIEAIPLYKHLVVEVKSGPEIIPLLKDLLTDHPKRSQIIFIAFGWDVIVGLKEAFPDLPSFWLSSKRDDVEAKWQNVVKAGLDGINLHYSIVDEALIKKAHKLGLGVLCWTVNNMEEVNRLISIGIDGITTDRPGYIREGLLREMDLGR